MDLAHFLNCRTHSLFVNSSEAKDLPTPNKNIKVERDVLSTLSDHQNPRSEIEKSEKSKFERTIRKVDFSACSKNRVVDGGLAGGK